MPNPLSNSSTPKSARTQSTIFSFFSTPSKKTTAGAAAANTNDSQDELLSQIDTSIDSAMLEEVEAAEREFSSPTKNNLTAAAAKRKRKLFLKKSAGGDDKMDVEMPEYSEEDDYEPPSADDDDADEDYDPASAKTLVSDRSGAGSRSRTVEDSDDDDDDDDVADGGVSDKLSEDTPKRASMAQPTHGRAGRLGITPFKAPDFKRVKSSTVGTSTSSEGTSLMAALGSSSAARGLTLSTGDDDKRARSAKFAKKNEERYKWLEDVRDAQKLRPTDVGYDKRTLHIPDSAWRGFSAFER
ncbi:DNA mismatch repair protein, partial [Coemansia sp. RSA 2049]